MFIAQDLLKYAQELRSRGISVLLLWAVVLISAGLRINQVWVEWSIFNQQWFRIESSLHFASVGA